MSMSIQVYTVGSDSCNQAYSTGLNTRFLSMVNSPSYLVPVPSALITLKLEYLNTMICFHVCEFLKYNDNFQANSTSKICS